MRTRRWIAALLFVGVIAGLAVPAEAKGKGRWNVRLFGSWTSSGGDKIVEPKVSDFDDCLVLGACYSVDAQDGTGLGLNVEFRVTRHRWGIELGGLTGEQDVSFGWVLTEILPPPPGETDPVLNARSDFVPMTVDSDLVYLAGNYHVLPEKSMVDFYVGVLFAGVSYGKDRISFLGESYEFDFDNGTGFGLNLAFDVYVAKHWFLGGGLRYVNVDSKFTIVDTMTGLQIYDNTLEMSPFMLSFGGGARF
jgi:hypothetical protein